MNKRSPVARRKAFQRFAEVASLEQRILFSTAHHAIRPLHPHLIAAAHRPLSVSAKPSTSAPSAPTALAAAVTASNIVSLTWTDTTSSASGYYVLRSTNGGSFSRIANLSSSAASSYSDAAVSPGNIYGYKVEAYSGNKTSTASNIASVTLAAATNPPAAPSALAASVAGSWVSLSWSESDSSTTGYTVLRSTDGVNYAAVAQLTSGSSTSYTDASVSAGQAYSYEVEASNAYGTSAMSNVASIVAPTASMSNGVVIDVRYGNELVITASGADDSVSLSESGSTFIVVADQQSYSFVVPGAGVFVYTRGGSDGINIDASVTVRTTVETIDGVATSISSAGTNVSAWIDSTDSYTGTGTIHRVSSFAGGVSKAPGASLADPSDSGSTAQTNLSLFGTGPVAGDVNQGGCADCYFLSSLAAFAGEKPSVLTEAAVDMGDGTYVVQFHSGTSLAYVRVSNDLATGYAHPGANNTIWAVVMEKAFAYFRTGANTYASLNNGWMSDVYTDLGVNSSNFIPSNYSASTFYNMVSADLANGEAVTLATSSSAPNLVSNHAYTVVSAYIDSNGVAEFVVRNPWGFSGDSLEDGQGYATLTFAQITANFFEGVQAVG